MWFFLFGNKAYHNHLGYIIAKCPECKKTGAFSIEQERKKFTVFFVPTLQYSKKQFMACSNCRQIFEVADELKAEIAGRLMNKKELNSALEQRRLKELASVPRCPGCGNMTAKGMNYCPECGRKL